MHELYDRYHKVFPNLNISKNTNYSVKNEVIRRKRKGLSHIKYPNSGLDPFVDISGRINMDTKEKSESPKSVAFRLAVGCSYPKTRNKLWVNLY